MDCIYEGGRALYIHPDQQVPHLADNAAFFTESLPGRHSPLGSPGGAAKVGPLGVDAPLVSGLPRGQE